MAMTSYLQLSSLVGWARFVADGSKKTVVTLTADLFNYLPYSGDLS